MDFNVWLGAKNPGKARSGNKQLLNVIHPKTLTVMTGGTKTTKDGYDAMRTILTRLLNHLRKHGHTVDTIYCDKESIFMSDRMRSNIGVDFNVTVLPAPTDHHAFMGEVETFNRVQANKVRVAMQHKEIPTDLWDLVAMEYHTPLYNRLPKRSRGGLSPWEMVTGRRPSSNLFFPFATPVVVKDHQVASGKGSDHGRTGYLVGYDLASMLTHSRVVYVPETNSIVRSRDYRLYDPVTKVETVPRHLMTDSLPVAAPPPRSEADIVTALSAKDFKALHDAIGYVAYSSVLTFKQGMSSLQRDQWKVEMLREMNDFIFKYRTVSGEWVSKGELPVDAALCRGIWCLEVKHDGRLRA